MAKALPSVSSPKKSPSWIGLVSDLCDFCEAFIVVKGRVTVEGIALNNRANKKSVFKNNTPFRSCISKTNNTFINDSEDLDIVMPMYNLLRYCGNYSVTSGSLWNYYRDKVNNDANEDNDANNYIMHNK